MKEPQALIKLIEEKFTGTFTTEPTVYKAPGRINLIGEHTDYNNGFVLPAAIDKAIYLAVAKNNRNKLSLYSIDFNESSETDISQLSKTDIQWANYLIGVMAQFQKRGLKPGGIDCVFGGNIPLGAGLSSSAALECGFAVSINDQFQFQIPDSELILMAQKAEHEFAGVMCGIMDQFASVFGRTKHVMKLDCRSLDFEYYPFIDNNIDIILCDSRVKHSLDSSEYNIRRAECEKGVKILQEKYPEIKSLRDAEPAMLEEFKTRMEANVYNRCSYVIHEIIRVENACQSLLKNDLSTFGKFMYETHDGLSKDYQVSCKELDILVDIARRDENVIGARMMGGGFGGCTINLVKKEDTEKFVNTIRKDYKKNTGIETEIYRVSISDGAGKLENQ